MAENRQLPDQENLPHALYRAEQVRALDRAAIEGHGIAGEVLMERAGAAAYALMRERWPDTHHICVLVGVGNNGGDGFVLARRALEAGCDVMVEQLGDPERIAGDALLNRQRCLDAGGRIEPYVGIPAATDVIVDGVFGTGLERPVSGGWAAALAAVNEHPAPVLALDIPSGLHADTGAELGVAVRADVTLSFIGLKQGLFTAHGPVCCGEIRFDGLQVPAAIYGSQLVSARRVDWATLATRMAPRAANAHKGDFGHVLVVGGAQGFGGAARLAAEAAARTGAGLISLATHPDHVAAVLAARPELMVRGITEAAELAPLLDRASVVALGPGLGQSDWSRALWRTVLEWRGPIVLDADGLNLLAEAPRERDNWVLTPHPGEAARLLGTDTETVNADRFLAVNNLIRRYGGVALLKGAGTLVAAGGTRPPAVCCDGNPGMASGGMGDVLTGVVAAMLAQGYGADLATEFAACLHGAAADAATVDGERGMLAADLMPWLRHLVNPS